MNWREQSAAVIAKVISEHGTEDNNALRRAISQAYPFGERRYYPYKIYLDETKKQLIKHHVYLYRKQHHEPTDQQELFS